MGGCRLFSSKKKCACGFLGLRVKGLGQRSQVGGFAVWLAVCSSVQRLRLVIAASSSEVGDH